MVKQKMAGWLKAVIAIVIIALFAVIIVGSQGEWFQGRVKLDQFSRVSVPSEDLVTVKEVDSFVIDSFNIEDIDRYITRTENILVYEVLNPQYNSSTGEYHFLLNLSNQSTDCAIDVYQINLHRSGSLGSNSMSYTPTATVNSVTATLYDMEWVIDDVDLTFNPNISVVSGNDALVDISFNVDPLEIGKTFAFDIEQDFDIMGNFAPNTSCSEYVVEESDQSVTPSLVTL